MQEEGVVPFPHAQAGVGPLGVVDDLERLLDAWRSGRADVATVVAMVIAGAVVAV